MTLTPIEKRAPQTKTEKKTDKAFSTTRGKRGKGKLLPKSTNHHLKEIKEAFGKNADPYFDHDAALAAAELVMKMDVDEARVYTHMVVSDLLEADIEKNLRTLQRRVDQIVAKRLDTVKKAMLSTVAKGADRDEALAHAQAIELIEKAIQNPYTSGAYRFEESDFRRDPRTGRFMTKVHVSSRSDPMHTKQSEMLGIPTKPGLSRDHTAQYQQEYQQLANFLTAVHTSSDSPGFNNVFLHLRNKNTGQRYTVAHDEGTRPNGDHWDPANERLEGVEAIPTNINVGGAAFSLTNSLGASTHTGTKVAHGVNQADRHMGEFAQQWDADLGDRDKYQSNARLYSRVSAGSKFVGQVAPHGSHAQIAAKFGEFIGNRGPEAEKVIGPTARKSGYRYRGTERTPDTELVNAYDRAVRLENRQNAQLPPEAQERVNRLVRQYTAATMAEKAKRQGLAGPEAARLSKPERERINAQATEQVEGEIQRSTPPKSWDAGRKVLIDYLEAKRLPDPEFYALHLDAGHTPPSEGFLIDRHGQITAQAVGYGDDHYLPFNLKNLKSLKGGEYIRTRSIGGPTTEDVYTAQVMGARKLTVVSRSGTFNIDFEDDFRGGRRHNDKARRMTGRYEKLLDSVQSETLDKEKVPAFVEDAITRNVEDKYQAFDPRQRRKMIKDRIKAFKEDPEMSPEDLDEFQEQFNRQSVGMTDGQKRELRGKMLNSWGAAMEFKYKLNANGYKAAMKALQEQFPYYIKDTNVVPYRTEPERFSPEVDRGYVEPGRLRPTQAAEGWHGVQRGRFTNPAGGGGNGSGKFSASHTDFQDTRAKYGSRDGRNRTSTPTRPAPATPAPAAPAASPAANNGGTPSPVRSTPTQRTILQPGNSIVQAAAAQEQQESIAQAAANVVANFHKKTNILDSNVSEQEKANNEAAIRQWPFLALTDGEERTRWFMDHPNDVRTLADMMDAVPEGDNQPRKAALDNDVVEAFRVATSKRDRKPYSSEMMFLKNNNPPLFPNEDAYAADASPEAVRDEVNRLSTEYPTLYNYNKSLGEYNDEELGQEVNKLGKLHGLLSQVPADHQLDPDEIKMALKAVSPGAEDKPGMARLGSKAEVEKQAEAVHRVRALNLHPSRANRNAPRALPARIEETPTPEVRNRREEIENHHTVLMQAGEYLLGSGDPIKEEIGRKLQDKAGDMLGFLDRGDPTNEAEVNQEISGASREIMLAHHIINNGADEQTLRRYLDNNNL